MLKKISIIITLLSVIILLGLLAWYQWSRFYPGTSNEPKIPGKQTELSSPSLPVQHSKNLFAEKNILCAGGCPSDKLYDNDDIIYSNGLFHYGIDPDQKIASWVFYQLDPVNWERKVDVARNWKADPALKEDNIQIFPRDYNGLYKKMKMDRGHLAPLKSFSSHGHAYKANYLSNIAPQYYNFNRGIWKSLESKMRQTAEKLAPDEKLFVYTGTIFSSPPAFFNRVALPEKFWKIAIVGKNSKYYISSWLFENRSYDSGDNFCNYKIDLKKLQKEVKNLDLLPALKSDNPVKNNRNVLTKTLGC